MPKYVLHYFNGRGMGDTIRQIFKLAHQDFEDVRFTHEQWPDIKEKMPFKQAPVLEEDGKMLPQSNAIARYLAKKFGYAGKGDWEQAQVDAIADQWKDFFNEIKDYFFVARGYVKGDLEKLKKDIYEPAVKKHFTYLTNILKANPSGFFVGDSVTYVDLTIAEFIAMYCTEDLADYPELKAHHEKVHNIPEIKKWIEERPESWF